MFILYRVVTFDIKNTILSYKYFILKSVNPLYNKDISTPAHAPLAILCVCQVLGVSLHPAIHKETHTWKMEIFLSPDILISEQLEDIEMISILILYVCSYPFYYTPK